MLIYSTKNDLHNVGVTLTQPVLKKYCTLQLLTPVSGRHSVAVAYVSQRILCGGSFLLSIQQMQLNWQTNLTSRIAIFD